MQGCSWVLDRPQCINKEGRLYGQMAAISDRVKTFVTLDPGILHFERPPSARQQGRPVIAAPGLSKLLSARRVPPAKLRRFNESCGRREFYMFSGTSRIGQHDPSSIVVLHGEESWCETEGKPAAKLGQPAVSAFNCNAKTSGPGCRLHTAVTTLDKPVFGGVCDRCGRTYLQCCFPHGCLCPRCSLAGSGACAPGLSVASCHLTNVGLASSSTGRYKLAEFGPDRRVNAQGGRCPPQRLNPNAYPAGVQREIIVCRRDVAGCSGRKCT